MAKIKINPKFSATVKVIKKEDKEGDVENGNRQYSNNRDS